jgi:NAD(P)-dependent dehydrogenase (short-subunit alcohol dehydrogenase family)
MTTITVTGCNRGIGLELCKQFAAQGNEVIGVCRRSNPELDALGIRVIEGINVGTDDCTGPLRDAIGDQPIDILVNNAGILRRESLGEIDYDTMLEQYQVNTLGPLRVTEALLSNLVEGSKVAIVTSRVGSIADNGSGGNYGYRASKAAVNMIGVNLMHDLKPRGIAVALLHPGLVATDMTGGTGIDPADSAAGLIRRIEELSMATSGHFWHAEGYELPW